MVHEKQELVFISFWLAPTGGGRLREERKWTETHTFSFPLCIILLFQQLWDLPTIRDKARAVRSSHTHFRVLIKDTRNQFKNNEKEKKLGWKRETCNSHNDKQSIFRELIRYGKRPFSKSRGHFFVIFSKGEVSTSQ